MREVELMKKILISSAAAVLSALALSTSSVHAGTTPTPAPPTTLAASGAPVGDAYVESGGPVTTVASAAPVPTVPPVLTVPATRAPLPVTGSDLNSTLAAGAIVLGVGGAMVIVGRTRRRRTVPAS